MELISTNGKRDSGTKFTSPEPGADLVWDDLRFSNTTGILPKKKKNYVVYSWVEVEQETRAPPPKKILDPPKWTLRTIYVPKPWTDRFARVDDKQPVFCSPPLVSVDLV